MDQSCAARSVSTKPFTLTSFNCATSADASGYRDCFDNLTGTHDSASSWSPVTDASGVVIGAAYACGSAAGLSWSSTATVKANVGWDLNLKKQKINGKLDFTWTSGGGWFSQITKARAGYVACPPQ